jgi:hypothetical protein
MLLRIAHFAYLAAFVFSCGVNFASAQTQPRAVIELFTSQGCSSCPPADRLLAKLAGDPTLIAMSVHIDYWDYIGWKDTLADPRNAARQRAYAYARGDRKVYTPQVVVNGSLHALGSDWAGIEDAIAKSRNLGAMSLPSVRLTLADGRLEVAVPDGAEERTAAEVWLWGLAKAVTVAIARGENKGRDITYHNVIRHGLKLGDWNGKADAWKVPLAALAGDGIDRAAVLVQSGRMDKPKTILGAALASIR